LVGSWVLSNGNCDCEVRCGDFWANSLVSHRHFNTNDCVLGAFSSLKEHVDVDMVNDVELFLGSDDVIFFLRWWLSDGLCTLFGILLAAFFRVSGLGGSCWCGFLFLFLRAILLFNFWLFFCCMATFLGSSS
jgi:hypothetical protein